MSKIVVQMFDQGASAALLLSMTSPHSALFPQFESRRALGPVERMSLWSGLRWDASLTPNLWSLLNGQGLLDLMPGDSNPATLAMRTAFGVMKDEHLFLVRLGTSSACTGVLACISRHSLVGELTALKPTFTTIKAA